MKEGGIFTILDNCLEQISLYNATQEYQIIALVGDKSRFNYPNIDFLEYPKSKKSWFLRLYYEYYHFKNLSKKINPDIWLSLHDISPTVLCKKRFVYCHHPTLFYKPTLKDWIFNPKIGIFSLLYKYLQSININKNKAVFVQQNWIKQEFEKMYKIGNVVVTKPEFVQNTVAQKIALDNSKVHFFYPSLARSFKNFEIIFEAINLLEKNVSDKIVMHLTLDKKNRNNYTNYLVKKYKDTKCINYIGILSKEEMVHYYNSIDCLVFPSKLETWGLPISEAKSFMKPMLLSNLSYAKETVGNYDKVSFFDVNNPNELADLLTKFVNKTILYQGNKYKFDTKNQLHTWFELFEYMLNDE